MGWAARLLLPASLLATVLAGGSAPAYSAQDSTNPPITIAVLSTRADLVSGGRALVEIGFPVGLKASELSVALGARDVTDSFTNSAAGLLEGLVTGLDLGPNLLRARLPDGSSAELVITNHPNGGPIFAGPQIQPWTCEPGAIDHQCNRGPVYNFLYESNDPRKSGFQPYDQANPPTDVATTTTDNGETLPFIVRVETGYQDRDQYQVATLFRPDQHWTALRPQSQFNHKLVIDHGASCDLSYATGSAPSVTRYAPADLLGLGSLPNEGDGAAYALGAGS